MRARRIAIVVGAWTAVALCSLLSAYLRIVSGDMVPTSGWMWTSVITIPFWSLVTFPIIWMMRRVRTVPVAIVAHLVAVAIVLALDGLVTWLLNHELLGREGTYWQHVWRWSFIDAAFYGGIVAVYYAARYYRLYLDRMVRASELEAELSRAQLQALQVQIRPHFLFNTLHTISGLVRTGEHAAAIEMLAGLGDLLRALLRSDGAQVVPLQREVELIARYLEIEQVRFGDRLHVEIAVEPGVENVLVPNLILQPLVENAIRHGLASTRAGELAIRCQRSDGVLRIAVSNSGEPPAGDSSGEGIGLANTRARLEHLYGSAHRFELLHTTIGTSAVLEIPLQSAPP